MCRQDEPTVFQLGIAIESDTIKVSDASVHGEWMCVPEGVTPPDDAKLSSYTASIGLVQVSGFALKDVTLKLFNLQSDPYTYGGTLKGTVAISPALSITLTVPFGKEVETYQMYIDTHFKVGDVNVAIKGDGKLRSVCENMGDLVINVDVKVTNIPVDWMQELDGPGTFESNCGDEWLLSLEVKFSEVPDMSLGSGIGADPPPDSKLTFGIHVKGGENAFQIAYTVSSMNVFVEILPSNSFNIGITIQETNFGDLFKDVGQAVPGADVDGPVGLDHPQRMQRLDHPQRMKPLKRWQPHSERASI